MRVSIVLPKFMKEQLTADAEVVGMFRFVEGFMSLVDEDTPDGAWFELHNEAVQAYNEEFGTTYDWHDVMQDYFTWAEKQK